MKGVMYSTMVGLVIILTSCGNNAKTEQQNQVISTTTHACPMLCEGDKTYEEAGKCPVCGMNLAEVK